MEVRDRFLAALDDDLDTPSAMVELESLARMALETGDDALAAQAGAHGARARRPNPRAAAGNRPGAEHRRRVTSEPDDDLVPVSVRLGAVVPPEDPEDWTRPLTWVAALGMLAGPIIALAWFVIAPPDASHRGAAGNLPRRGSRWRPGPRPPARRSVGAARAATATIGAGLFAALVVIILGVVAGR